MFDDNDNGQNSENLYDSQPNPYALQISPQINTGRTSGKSANYKSRQGRLIAAVLAAGLIGGAAGGGGAAWWMISNQEPMRTDTAPIAQSAALIPDSVAAVTEPDESQYIAQVSASLPATTAGDITSVVQKAGASVVEITLSGRVMSFFGEQEVGSAGSGVILSADGYVVTNNHVVENSDRITVRTSDGTEYEAKLIGTDTKTDIAVIKVEADGLTPVTFADSGTVQVGQIAVAIGNPLGTLGGTVTNGIVSAKDREITIDNHTMTLLQTSAAVNPGNSGGGLFDAEGALIGVVNAKSGGLNIEGIGFAIPSNLVRQVTDDLIKNGYVTGRPELGVKILEVTDQRAAAYYGVSGTGVYIMETTRENGLKAGDRLISINGGKILSALDVSGAVSKSKVGDKLNVTLERGGEILTLDVTVGEQIPESVREAFPKPTGI